MSIPFTQYLLPDGRKQQIDIARPPDIETLARKFIACGGRFEAEILTTGQVSLTANINDEDVEIEICGNGPDVPEAVDRLIQRAVKQPEFKRGKNE